jgi:hypothetical protein
VATVSIYDNTDGAAVLMADKSPDRPFEIRDMQRWSPLKKALG